MFSKKVKNQIPIPEYRETRMMTSYVTHNIKAGIIRYRQITDFNYVRVFCLMALLLMVMSCRYFLSGSLRTIFNGIDSFGNICGKNNRQKIKYNYSHADLTDRRYLLQIQSKENETELRLCVSSCTSKNDTTAYLYPNMTTDDLCHFQRLMCQNVNRERNFDCLID